MRVELNLAGTIKNYERVVRELGDVVDEVINVLYQILHTVDQPAVWPIVHQLLNIVESYHVSYVQVAPVLEDLSSGVEIDHLEGPLVCVSYLLESVT